jgi:hypothetical protein
MNPRQNSGPNYIGLFVPLIAMAVMIYWLVS